LTRIQLAIYSQQRAEVYTGKKPAKLPASSTAILPVYTYTWRDY